MATWRNPAGYALSSPAWLRAHHRAKLPERTSFAERLAAYRPARVVDLGCATGLWLDLLDKVLPPDCRLVGIDNDSQSLDAARERARTWNRESEFMLCDIDSDYDAIPQGDLTLAFNVFPYLSRPGELLNHLHRPGSRTRTAVRQYDGTTIRIGPIPPADRLAIDSSLHAALGSSKQFSHYDMDRTYDVLLRSGLAIETLTFELTERHAPFPDEFVEYFEATVEWTRMHLSDDARARLTSALRQGTSDDGPLYFAELDLVAVVSSGW